MSEPRTIMQLVPRKPLTFALLFLLGVAVIAGLEGLYFWMPKLAGLTTDGRVASFDLDGEGSLSVWFSSMLLSLASATALLVYSVRRMKADDYFGRYRIWLWAAFAWLVMSIDETGSLHEGFKEAVVYLTGKRVYGDGSLYWVAPYLLILSIIGLRLLRDMWGCRSSIAAIFACAACYVVAVLAQLGVLLPEAGAREVMLEEGAEMLGDLFLLLSMGLHARFVILESQGMLLTRKAKKKATASDEKSTTTRRSRPATEAASSSEPRTAGRPQTATSLAAAGSRNDHGSHGNERRFDRGESFDSRHGMSKAERKAMRRRERARRAELDDE